MKLLVHGHRFFFVVLCIFLFAAQANTQTGAKDKDILVKSELAKGFDMGVNTSEGRTDWLKKGEGEEGFKMSFPAEQAWAAVFITYGKPKPMPRPQVDLSAYRTLSIEMRGESGREKVEIGIKSNTQPDNGEEKKFTIELTPKWETYTFSLDKFTGADLKNLYVVTEFVYDGKEPQTAYFKNIKYLAK